MVVSTYMCLNVNMNMRRKLLGS